jgi:protocatechuate 3,4-dioxygenase beta subunit
VALAAEMNCCLYWFHPLAWWLKQQLAALAEQACDDAAINSIGNRTQYARHLLEVAAAVARERGRLVPYGVSMARRTSIESRILAILDFTRPLSQRLTWTSTLLLLGVMIPLVALAAALQPASGGRERAAGDATAIEKTSEAAEAERPASGDENAAEGDPTFVYAGSVADSNEKPVADAEVRLEGWQTEPPLDQGPPAAITDAQGRFQFTRRKSDFREGDRHASFQYAKITVRKESFGLAILPAASFETTGGLEARFNERERPYFSRAKDAAGGTIKLVADDVPIEGRVVGTEGQPVVGALVEVTGISEGEKGSLETWLEFANKPGADYWSANAHLHGLLGGSRIRASREYAALSTKTDEQGRFVLRGLGHERIATIFVSAPGVETAMFRACSRKGEIVKLPGSARNPDTWQATFYPHQFTHVVGPSQTVEGRVTDKKTGQPLAGLLIKAEQIATNPVGGSLEASYARTVTDADGRYRLTGLPLGDNTIMVLPAEKSRHLIAGFYAQTKASDQPLTCDVELTQGILVRGRVSDSRTGKPLSGTVQYFAFNNNPHLREARGFAVVDHNMYYRTDDDGKYEIPVLPGNGILTFNVDDHEHYARGAGSEVLTGPKTVTNGTFFHTAPYHVTAGNFHLLKGLDLAADAEDLDLDLSLASGVTFTARLRTSDGQPLADYYIYGEQSYGGWHNKRSGETIEVKGYLPEEGRRVMIYHPERNLVGLTDVTGPAPQNLDIELRPGGAIRGRVVDEGGQPLEDLQLYAKVLDFYTGKREQSPESLKDRGEFLAIIDGLPLRTGKDGRFEISGLMPGLKYTGGVTGTDTMNGRRYIAERGLIFNDVTIDPGQTKDLGDLQIKPRQPTPKETEAKSTEKVQQPNPNPEQAKAASAPIAPSTSDLRGRVVDDTGKSLAGAKLYSFQSRVSDLSPIPPRLIATTSAAGEFTLASPGPDFNDEQWPDWRSRESIVIIAPSHGFLVTSRDEIARQPPAGNLLGALFQAVAGNSVPTVRLPPAGETIRGRLVDIDGRPVAGATVKIRWFEDIVPARLNRAVGDIAKSDWQVRVNHLLRVIEPVQLRDILPQGTTDSSGRFELRDLGSNRLFQLLVQSDQTESIDLVARNLDGEPINIPPERNFRDREVTLLPREFDRALGPSKPVTGRVVDLDTGEPIAGAVVRAYAVHGINLHSSRERQEFATRTGTDGRYRITGLPIGNENHLAAFAIGDVAYIPISHQVDTSQSGDVHQDFRLKRGIWATGRVYDAETDKPFVGQISYYWFRNRELEQQIPGLRRAFVDELYWTNGNGEFRLPVLPTRGILAFRYAGTARDRDGIDRFARGAGADAIEGSQAMGALKSFATMPSFLIPTNYERVAEVNPARDETTVRVDLPLFASPPVKIRVVDAEGNAVPGCEVYGANERWGWRKQQAAEFSLEDLRSGERRKVLAFHRLINLAGGVIVSRDDPQPIEIKLAPAGSITGRLVDKSGQAITDAELHADYDKLKTDGPSAIWANHPTLYSNPTHIPVDETGRFQLDGLIPGWSYNAYATAPRKLNGQMIRNLVIGTAFDDVRTGPGEKRDLGDITIDVK